MSKNQSKFLSLAVVGIVLLTLGELSVFFRQNLLFFLAIVVVFLFEIKSRWLYFFCLCLSIVLPFLLFFFPDEKINQNIGDFIYFFLGLAMIKQLAFFFFEHD